MARYYSFTLARTFDASLRTGIMYEANLLKALGIGHTIRDLISAVIIIFLKFL